MHTLLKNSRLTQQYATQHDDFRRTHRSEDAIFGISERFTDELMERVAKQEEQEGEKHEEHAEDPRQAGAANERKTKTVT